MSNNEKNYQCFMLWLPFVISFACVVFDIAGGVIGGIYQNISFVTITRTIMGYLFPTIIACVITLICQTKTKDYNLGIKQEMFYTAIMTTILYFIFFIVYLIMNKYYTIMSILIILITIGYALIFYNYFIDDMLKISLKDNIT